MAEDYETHITDRSYFLRFNLAGYVRQYYNLLTTAGANCKPMIKAFDYRYFSSEKQDEISERLATLNIQDYKKEDLGDYHAALDLLIDNINRLTPMESPKDRDEGAKNRFLREAVTGTESGLRATSRVADRQSYQSQI